VRPYSDAMAGEDMRRDSGGLDLTGGDRVHRKEQMHATVAGTSCSDGDDDAPRRDARDEASHSHS